MSAATITKQLRCRTNSRNGERTATSSVHDMRRSGAETDFAPSAHNVPGDQLIGDLVEIVTDDLRLGPTANTSFPAPNEGSSPSGCDGAERVPAMASDKEQLRWLRSERTS